MFLLAMCQSESCGLASSADSFSNNYEALRSRLDESVSRHVSRAGQDAGAFQDIPQSASHTELEQNIIKIILMVRLMLESESDPATRSQGYKREDTLVPSLIGPQPVNGG